MSGLFQKGQQKHPQREVQITVSHSNPKSDRFGDISMWHTYEQ